MAVRIMHLEFLVILRSRFVGKKKMQPFIYFSFVFFFVDVLHKWNMSSNVLVFHTSGGISSWFATFLALIYFQYCVKFFHKLTNFDVQLTIINFFSRFINDFKRVSIFQLNFWFYSYRTNTLVFIGFLLLSKDTIPVFPQVLLTPRNSTFKS